MTQPGRPKNQSDQTELSDRAGPVFTTEKGDSVQVWYGDGDLLAVCHGNLGLNVSAREIADALVEAIAATSKGKST